MPSGALQNSNLEEWRSWLRRHFDVTIWHCEDDVWFSDARVATCVILASRRSESGPFGRLHFVDVRERVEGMLADIEGIPSPVRNAVVRDISSIAPSDDILVAGARPELLAEFEVQPAVSRLNALSEVGIYSGNKLGHAFFQLRDLAPSNRAVLRRVTGLKLEFEINKSYLTPLLSSPKDERTGEFAGSDYWVLSAPESLPSTGVLRRYIEHGRELHVPDAPSIAQRGDRWWTVEWRRSQVAVQIHPGFLHQVWWSEEPFVAKNNFHTLEFRDDLSQSDREMIAASLASGWGALSALFISSEVGCEGVRWLSTTQFGAWPVLKPASVLRDQRAAVLRVYRLFRRLEAREIPAMDATALAAWLSLTEEVARAAGMASPGRAAAECIEIARQTCVRRTHRETIALAGRMSKGRGDGGALAKHVQSQLEISPLAISILDNLTGGERELRLRTSADLAQTAFDFDDKSFTLPGEGALAAVLGASFECAPRPRVDDPDYLARDINELITSLISGIVGDRPADGDSARNTYNEIAEDVRRASVQWLQRQVRKRLS